MSVHERSGRGRYQMLGLVFLVVSALFFALMIGFYQKAFTPFVSVTLNTDRVGNQMSEGADVKARGVVVGEVRSVESDSGHAKLELGLNPAMAANIPPEVSARLLPKTLFGERYVALGIPENSSPDERISAGDVITQDRSESAMEVEKVLDDLLPLLQAVQPQKLATTLNAVSQAVEGRGEQLGNTLVEVNRYLERFNPSLPDLESVIRRIDNVSDTYSQAAPDMMQAFSDLTTTTRTIAQQREQLQQLWETANVVAVNSTDVIAANRDNLIQLSATSRPTLELFGRYAPEYPCMLKQVADGIPTAEAAFGKGDPIPMQKVTIEVTGSRGKYLPEVDTPRYEDTRGPRCYPWYKQPDRFPQYPPGGPLEDGSTHPPPPHEPGDLPLPDPAGMSPQSTSGSNAAHQVANSPTERDLVAALLAPSLGTPPDRVPGWSSVLVGPVYRGTEVALR